jgi:hypothetical protein
MNAPCGTPQERLIGEHTPNRIAVVASGPILLVYLGFSLAVIGLRRRMSPLRPGSSACLADPPCLS